MLASRASEGARVFPLAFPFVFVFGIGDGFPSEVGGVGDGTCGVPNTNCGVVFVEEDALSGGDDGKSSGRDRCEAGCEEA